MKKSAVLMLLRHGAPEPEPVFRYTGQREVLLSQAGAQEARRWGEALAEADVSTIYTSPLRRCLDTARIIGGRLGKTALCAPELMEIDLGEWEGLTREAVKARYPGAYEARGADMAGFRPPGGESFSDLLERALPFCRACLESGQRILAVTHAGVIRVVSCRASGTPLDRLFDYRPPPAGMSIFIPGTGGLELFQGGILPWAFNPAALSGASGRPPP
jgi:probable phosphoglycerate mutase